MIFISYDHNGKVNSIVCAKSKELANAFWQGKNIEVFTSKCLENPDDFTPLDEHITGVFEILKTEIIQVPKENERWNTVDYVVVE